MTTTEKKHTITAEEKLRNVAEAMLRYSEVKRQWNGKGRSSTYVGSTDTLAQTGRQLAELVTAYLDGYLDDTPVDDLPF